MVAWLWLVTSKEGVEVKRDLANHWLQAAQGCALLFALAQWPRVPEPKRWVTMHDQ
jgi:hypothetical protein